MPVRYIDGDSKTDISLRYKFDSHKHVSNCLQNFMENRLKDKFT